VTGKPDATKPAPDLGALAELAPQLAQTFASIASDIALVVDAQGVIRNVALGNEAFDASAAAWVGRHWADTVTGDTRGKVEQLLADAQASGVTRRREINHTASGGQDIPVAYAAVRLGRDGPVLAVGRDLRAVAAIQQRYVDAQRELERAYWQQRQAESRYRLLFQVATDAVLVVDARTLRIVEANSAAGGLFRTDATALAGEEAAGLVAETARSAVVELLSMARTSGRPAEIRAMTRAAGGGHAGPRYIDMSATPFRADDTRLLLLRARPTGADAASSQEARRLADLVERTPDAVVITDPSGRVLMANPAFIALCQAASEGQVVGRGLDAWAADVQRRFEPILLEARRLGIAARKSLAFGRPGAPTVEVEVSAALLADVDQECIGLTMRPIGTAAEPAPPQVLSLAAAIDQLATQLGVEPLHELLHEASELAERHLISTALAQSHGRQQQAAQRLGITAEQLALRMRHLRLDGDGHEPVSPPLLN
jgi:transcriptional regulator PpsR